MKRKVLFPLMGKKDLPAGLKIVLLLLAVLLGSGNTFSQNWNQLIKTVANDRTSGGYLGFSVAISGDYAIVGAPNNGSGAAYIFQRSGTNWVQMQKIVASDADSDDNFGTSVAISGDYVVVGAVYDNGDAANTDFANDAGSAYIFKRTGSTWAQEQKIVASDRQEYDYFGYSVAISGDYVVVGSFLQDLDDSGGTPIADAGAAYIYRRSGTTWAQEQKIIASERLNDDNFGVKVAISGDYVVVGCAGEDEDAAGVNTLGEAGAAYVFFRTGTTWVQQQKIVASDRGASDGFGISASISGDYLIIGALKDDEDAAGGNAVADAGSAYIFTRTGTTWAQQQKIVASDRGLFDNFGFSVSISGDYAIIGAVYESENASGTATLTRAGSAYIIGRSGTTWTQIDKIVASDRAAHDNFGRSVAISGDYAIVGAPYEDEDATGANTLDAAGSAYVFKKCGTITGTTTVTNVACNAGTSGAINLTPAGGTGPYTFSWAGGVTTEDRTGLAAGSYSVTIRDFYGCTGTVSGIVVTQPTAVSGSTVVTNVACNSGTNGAVNLTPSGGAGGYSFSWGGGITTEDRTGLAAGTYSVTITDANNCTKVVSGITVTQPTAVSGSTVVTNIACNSGTTGAINLTPAGGTGPYTFSWGGGITTEDRTNLAAGTYSVTITDANACTGTVSGITVTQPTALSMTASSQINLACNGGATGAAAVNNANGGAGGYTYNWTPGNPTGDGTTSVTDLTAGTYTVTVTDLNGCTASQSFTVTQPPVLSMTASSQTNVACNGGSTGAAAVNNASGGVGGYTYNWIPGNPTGDGTTSVSGLTAGTYLVIVTDAYGCSASQSFTVTQPTALSMTASSQTNVACNGGSTGAAAVNNANGGAGGYTYNWTPGNPTGDGTTSVTGLTAGTYTVTVTDANTCTASQSFTVTQPTAISMTAAAQTNVACFGNATGSFTINSALGGAGSFTYDWAPGTPAGDGTTTVTGLTAGTYSVTATDANSCTATITFTITQPTALSVTASSQTNVACNGGATGAAAINTPTGGTPGYTYDWSPGTPIGDGTPSATALVAGTWAVNVTDANGCAASQSFTITEPAAITNTIDVTSCDTYTLNGYSYGSSGTYTQLLVSQSGCDSTLTLNLTINNSTTEMLNETSCSFYTLNGTTYAASGTYTQTLTNAAGCDSIITLNLIITQPTSETLTETACDSYTLNGMSYTSSGTYTQTLTNVAGCDSTLTLILTINTSTVSTLTETACENYTLNGSTYTSTGVYTQVIENAAGCDSTITLNLTINNATASTLIGTACESFTLNGQTYVVTGTYTQLLTSSAGCDSILTLTLTINAADADTTTATACTSYLWNGQIFTTSGFYTLSFTNANGCDSVENLDLTILPSPVAGITSLSVIDLQASGTGTYQWINCSNGQPISGAITADFTATSNGSYAVIVSNGSCSDTSDCVVITQVGLEENNSSLGVALTPNPTQNDVKVTFTGPNEASVVIYDAHGKAVMTANHVQSGEILSTEGFERGVYMVHILTTSGNHTERLVKQ